MRSGRKMAGTQSDTDRMSQTWVYRRSGLTGSIYAHSDGKNREEGEKN